MSPLILPADETVTVEVLSPTEELILTIDGQEHERLVPGQKVVARRAPEPVRLVRFAGQTFLPDPPSQAQVGGSGGEGGGVRRCRWVAVELADASICLAFTSVATMEREFYTALEPLQLPSTRI